MSFVYSALFLNKLLACSGNRWVTCHSTWSIAADLSHISAATSAFSVIGPVSSAKSLPCDLRAYSYFFLDITSNTLNVRMIMW